MRQPDRTPGIMRSLHRAGITLHIEAFGTGRSSLQTLHRFPSTRSRSTARSSATSRRRTAPPSSSEHWCRGAGPSGWPWSPTASRRQSSPPSRGRSAARPARGTSACRRCRGSSRPDRSAPAGPSGPGRAAPARWTSDPKCSTFPSGKVTSTRRPESNPCTAAQRGAIRNTHERRPTPTVRIAIAGADDRGARHDRRRAGEQGALPVARDPGEDARRDESPRDRVGRGQQEVAGCRQHPHEQVPHPHRFQHTS